MKEKRQRATRVIGWTELLESGGAPLSRFRSEVGTLDNNGRRIEESHFDETGLKIFNKQFDEEGRPLEVVSFNAAGAIEIRYAYHYDASGREAEMAMILPDGVVHKRCSHVYGNNGKKTESRWFDSRGDLEVVDTYEYEETTRTVRKRRGSVAEWTYRYDERSNLLSESGGYYSDDVLATTRYVYGQSGLLVERTELEDSVVRRRTTYQYSRL